MLRDEEPARILVSGHFSDESVSYSVYSLLESGQPGTEFFREPFCELNKETWPQYYQYDNDQFCYEYVETEDDKAVHRSAE